MDVVGYLWFIGFINVVWFALVSGNLRYLEDGKCTTNSDCMLNALCQNTRCVCKPNFVPSRHFSKIDCIEVASSFGGPCTEDIQCSKPFGAKAECQKTSSNLEGKCGCQKHTHFQDGICYESVRIGEHCLVSDNCISLSNISTYCYLSKCVCAPNYESNIDGTDCILIRNVGDIGSQCTTNENCGANHSVCVADICHCEKDFVISKDRKKCLAVADQLGGGCEEDTQCTALLKHTYCETLVQGCQCLLNAREINNSCWITAKLGESCSHDWECYTRSEIGASCDNKICKCGKGYKMNTIKTDCIANASLLEHSRNLLILSAVLAVLHHSC